MAKNTLIIEMVGLPACGKSTLCNNLKNKLQSENLKVYTWYDITTTFKKSNLKVFWKCISFYRIYKHVKMYLTLNKNKSRPWLYLWISIKISIIYFFTRECLDADVVVIDHGFFQHAISLQCGSDIYVNSSFRDAFIDLIHIETDIDVLIECYIPVDVAIRRMKKRGRIGEGRLDSIGDEESLSLAFVEEKKNFDYIFTLARNRCLSTKVLALDMNTDEQCILDNLIRVLKGEDYFFVKKSY